jgi:DNA-binding LacI/PurR family transcriptional regulator
MREVAALAGVSIKTVSNVVNNNPHVTARTRARVEHAIRQLGYTPNVYARSLRGGRSGVVALAIPSIESPYFAELARSIGRAAQTRGWSVFIDETDGELERELAVLRGLESHMLDGLIFSPLSLGPAEFARLDIGRPVVMLGERSIKVTADHVVIDNVTAAKCATEHLLAIGRRRIAAIGHQPNVATNTARLRVEGYRAALAGAGVVASHEFLREPAAFTREEGANAMAHLLALPEPPDAVFCLDDLMAIGAMRAIHDHGLKVPDDIAVIGFDDIAESRFHTPSLSTIAPHKAMLAESAVALLERQLQCPDKPPEIVEVGFDLLKRESTST